MNALTPVSNGNTMLVPENMDQAMRLATAMANAKMVPRHLQGDVGSCLMIVEQATRWRASPFAVAQCTSNIGGKLAYEGKLIAAILPSCGAVIGELNYQYHGDPKNPETLSVTVSGLRASDGEVKTIDLEWSKAKTTNEFWIKQPEQQLCYAGARVWARRWTPGPLLGIYAPEEFEAPKDNFAGTMSDIRPDPAQVMQPLEPKPDPEPPRKTTVAEWLKSLDVDLANARTGEEVDAILARPDVQKAQDALRNGARDQLQHMIDTAIARTSEASSPDFEAEMRGDDEPAPGDALSARVADALAELQTRDRTTLADLQKQRKWQDFLTELEMSGRNDQVVQIRNAVQAASIREPAPGGGLV